MTARNNEVLKEGRKKRHEIGRMAMDKRNEGDPRKPQQAGGRRRKYREGGNNMIMDVLIAWSALWLKSATAK